MNAPFVMGLQCCANEDVYRSTEEKAFKNNLQHGERDNWQGI